jgi:hypothetical protein
MRWRCEWGAGGICVDGSEAWRRGRVRCVQWALVVGLVCACAMGWAQSTLAAVGRCPNEEFRTGPSASLPDCRAYELVTPEELGRTQAITFTVADQAIPSADGEHLALKTLGAPLEPNPNLTGTRAVFSRTERGWVAKSAESPEVGAREVTMFQGAVALSPDLSQIAFQAEPTLNQEERKSMPTGYEVGPVGGPYTLMANIPGSSPDIVGTISRSYIVGANAGTASVPALSNVLFESNDHQILPEGPERTIAEETEPGAFSYDLYDWTGGALRLVNVGGGGSNVKKLNACGTGRLGAPSGGESAAGPAAVGAVSADGSKIFFSSCGGLYMRVDGRETVEVSKPEVPISESERSPVVYNAASADGSEVVFQTRTPLLAGETASENKLFIYNTVTHDLKLIANGIPGTEGTGENQVLISEDGSAVYYQANESIHRYETRTGITSFVAAIHTPAGFFEPSYTTPNGRFLVFVSGIAGIEIAGPHGLELEPRGVGHNELYRYDAADGSVMCVSCGEGAVAPAEGEMFEPTGEILTTVDGTPPFIQVSDDGERVFFQTTAHLVPQDTNSTGAPNSSTSGASGMDVYEWEADGAEEGPGVVCGVAVGCTHLLSSGEDVGRATFLGASEDGRNMFFATAAQLVPQATPEFPNIYDARVEGGFPPPRKPVPCLSCQGVGSPPPLFNTPASVTFTGAGNPPVGEEKPKPKPKSKPKKRHKKMTKAKRGRSHKGGGRS